MTALLKKEIASFFSSITGYLVMIVFLLTTGLFLWVIPGEFNILFSGYATLEPLFYLAPWIYLFLVPAITMRLFADEKKSGTLELLLSRPLTTFQIISAKYLSALVVVTLSLLPTLLYFFTVYQLGNPVGNLDTGATWGSYIGLVLLAAIYAAIGTFASSITDNQVVAFILAVLLCFFFYAGFDSLGTIPGIGGFQSVIASLGIEEHYSSISKGVINSKDLIYFASIIGLFLYLTRTVIDSRKW
jgi:ABC-2 type transport system permease protein